MPGHTGAGVIGGVLGPVGTAVVEMRSDLPKNAFASFPGLREYVKSGYEGYTFECFYSERYVRLLGCCLDRTFLERGHDVAVRQGGNAR